jgi:hypothetical protein
MPLLYLMALTIFLVLFLSASLLRGERAHIYSHGPEDVKCPACGGRCKKFEPDSRQVTLETFK